MDNDKMAPHQSAAGFSDANGDGGVHTFVTKNEWVYGRLKAEITSGMLQPDGRMVVSSIARRLGVSPMPVREAIGRLSQEGLVHITPHSGAKVASVNLVQLREIIIIRRELETLAARLAVPLLTPEVFAQLDSLLGEMSSCVERLDSRTYEQYNYIFHKIIYANCGNQTLAELISSLWDRSSITRMTFAELPEQLGRSMREHREWMAAAKAGDAETVARIVHGHLKASVENLIARLRK